MRYRVEVNKRSQQLFKVCNTIISEEYEHEAEEEIVDKSVQFIDDLLVDLTVNLSEKFITGEFELGWMLTASGPLGKYEFLFKLYDVNIRYTEPKADAVCMFNVEFIKHTPLSY